MKIIIETIPHKEQRYSAIGDWQIIDNELRIKVSDLGDPKYNMLIAQHEMAEALLCFYRGISESAVDKWDMEYSGEHEEPGADPDCPYHDEHLFATECEYSLAQELGVDWQAYEQAIENLE